MKDKTYNFCLGKGLLAFLAGALLMTALGQFAAGNQEERAFYSIKEDTGELIYDVGRQSWLKYNLQPHIFSLYLRLPKAGSEPIAAKLEGLEAIISQGSKKSYWQILKPLEPLKPRGNRLPLNLEIALPKEKIQAYAVGEGYLQLYKKGQPYQKITIKIINSRYKK